MIRLDLSIVIPVYNSEAILPQLLKEIEAAMVQLNYSDSFQLILINDASPDKSWEAINRLTTGRKYLTAISLMKNFGQHNAIMAGLKYAEGEVVIIMDDDLQHSPYDIKSLVTEIKNGADVCYVKYKDRKHAAWKKIGSAFNACYR